MANIALTPAQVIAGEAVHGSLQERFNDMVHIASVMANRARATGRTLKDVVSASHRGVKQFSAYGKSLPPGTKSLVSLAERALAMVEQNGPITPATYYATPKARTSLPPGLKDVGKTTGHVYAVDPENRAIGVGSGFVRPSVGLRNPTNPMGGVSVAESRQFMPPDRPMPSGPIATERGPGLAALAPHGLPTGTLGNFDRTGLSPRLNAALNAFNSDSSLSGVGVNSGYRDPSRNRRAGGAKQSQHLQGNAVDLDVSGMRPEQKAALLDKALEKGNFKGIGVYPSGNSLHLDVRRSPMAWGPSPAGAYSGIQNADGNPELSAREIGLMPGWAQPAIRDMYGAGIFAVTPRTTAPTPTPRPANPAYEAQQRQQMASTMQEAGIRGLGATSQLSAPIGNVERQNLQAPTQYAGRPSSVARSVAGPALAAALEKRGISSPTQYAGRPSSVASRVAGPVSMGSTVGFGGMTEQSRPAPLSDQNAAARMGPQPAGAIYSPSPTGARVGTGPISAPRAPTQYEGRPSSVARSVAGPNLSRALAERGLTGSTGAAPSSMAPDRPMPSGAISRPNLAAALEKRGIASPTQYAGRPASVASRVASATSAGSTVGIPGQTAPESPTLGPAPTAPGDVTQTTIGPAGIRPGLIATGPIQTRPKVSIPAPTRVAPVRTQPRVVQPVQQPPQPIQPVQAPAPLGQQAFAARANPVDPGLRAADVYGGAIGTAQTSTPGTTVSRQNSWGPTTVTNKFGAQTAMVGDRQAAVGKPFGGLGGNLSPNAKSVLGGLAGGILGAMAAGPTGALAGGMLGRKMASGGLGGSSAPGGGGGQAGGGLLGGMFGGGTVGNARGGNNERSGGTGGGTIGGGGGRGRRGGQGN